jgi:long-chain acyl-CoA synthetase
MKEISNLAESLDLAAKKYPDKVALIFKDRHYTYESLNNFVNQASNFLLKQGIIKGDRVLLCLPNCLEFIISFYAVIKTGAILVPIVYLLKPHEIKYIIDDSEPNLIITDFKKELEFREIASNQKLIVVNDADTSSKNNICFWKSIYNGLIQLSPCNVNSEDICCILYTSGTTGNPKGVMLTHENYNFNLSYLIDNDKFGIYTSNTTRLGTLPLYHILGQVANLLSTFSVGGTLILLERFQTVEVLEAITKYKPNTFYGVPTMYIYISNQYDSTKHDLSSLQYCVSSGAPLPDKVQEFFKETTGIDIANAYGITESTGHAFFHPQIKEKGKPKPNSVGHDLKGNKIKTYIKIVDDCGEEVSSNTVGELIVKGKQVMKGYWKKPEETAEVIVNGWLYTGDLAKKDDDGYYYIVDRKKDLILVGGRNVVPREVEQVLYQNDKIAEAAVVGVPDNVKGEIVKAVVALKDNFHATEKEIIDYCKFYLADYKVPKIIEFRAELEKSSTGKILRRLCK